MAADLAGDHTVSALYPMSREEVQFYYIYKAVHPALPLKHKADMQW